MGFFSDCEDYVCRTYPQCLSKKVQEILAHDVKKVRDFCFRNRGILRGLSVPIFDLAGYPLKKKGVVPSVMSCEDFP